MAVPATVAPGDEIEAAWGNSVAALLAKVVDPKFLQTGTITITGDNTASKMAVVSFPTAFVNAPAALASIAAGTGVFIVSGVFVTGTPSTIQITIARRDSAVFTSAIVVRWLAIDLTYLRS